MNCKFHLHFPLEKSQPGFCSLVFVEKRSHWGFFYCKPNFLTKCFVYSGSVTEVSGSNVGQSFDKGLSVSEGVGVGGLHCRKFALQLTDRHGNT